MNCQKNLYQINNANCGVKFVTTREIAILESSETGGQAEMLDWF